MQILEINFREILEPTRENIRRHCDRTLPIGRVHLWETLPSWSTIAMTWHRKENRSVCSRSSPGNSFQIYSEFAQILLSKGKIPRIYCSRRRFHETPWGPARRISEELSEHTTVSKCRCLRQKTALAFETRTRMENDSRISRVPPKISSSRFQILRPRLATFPFSWAMWLWFCEPR